MGKWIWQCKDWPSFSWDHTQTQAYLHSIYRMQGYIAGLTHPLRDVRTLITKALTENIVASYAIEGERLAASDLSVEFARTSGGINSGERARQPGVKESNAVAFISNVFDGASHDLTELRLGIWQRCVLERTYSTSQIKQPALWRTENIKVVSGVGGNRATHFAAPDPSRVQHEMEAFLDWFSSSLATQDIDPISRAALAHLWFVTIHPFEDGNGRAARACSDLALFQSDPNAVMYPMARYILADRENYYRALEQTQSSDLDVTDWMIWFLKTLQNALNGAIARLSWAGEANSFGPKDEEQRLLTQQVRLLVMMHDDPDQSVISASQYAATNNVSKATATRHLTDLVGKGYLRVCGGGGRSTRYCLSNV